MASLLQTMRELYQKGDRAAGGRLELARVTFTRFLDLRGLESSAALAYYALFSLFPLMLFLVSILSFLLSSSEQAYYQTLMFVRTALPVSRRLIEENLQQVYEHRGSIGVFGLLWLLWSATGFFTILARNINLAWPSVRLRNVMQSRLVAVAMVGGLIVLLLLSLLSTFIVESLPQLLDLFRLNRGILTSPLWFGVLRLVPGIFTFLLFLALYLWVPSTSVRWAAAWRGAVIATLAWEMAKEVFSTYVSSSLNSYEFLYGSLGSLTALLFWIYLSSVIVLLGAHMVAALDMRADRQASESAAADGTPARSFPTLGVQADPVPEKEAESPEAIPARGFGIDDPARLKPVKNATDERI